jgi:hypothetical protein
LWRTNACIEGGLDDLSGDYGCKDAGKLEAYPTLIGKLQAYHHFDWQAGSLPHFGWQAGSLNLAKTPE